MPELGEIRRAADIGSKGHDLYAWLITRATETGMLRLQDGIDKQMQELKQEIRLLRWELRQRTSEIPEPSNHSVYEEAAKL